MTTLTPFRLFQICKYALNQYTSNSPLVRRAGLIKQKVQAITAKRDRKRMEDARVGFHVEERRGWDVKPVNGNGKDVDGAEGVLGAGAGVGVGGTGYPLRIPGDPESASSEGKARSTLDLRTDRYTPSSSSTPTSSSSSGASSSPFTHTPSSSPSSSSSSRTPPDPYPESDDPDRYPNEITRLMAHPALFTPLYKPPRNVIVLCHGLYGFSTATPIPLFPSLKLHYWHSVLSVLREQLGCKVMVVGVKGTGSIEERAGEMDRWLREKLPKGTGVNFVAHSMGGLDCRYLITHLKPETYKPLSLTMIGTPNRGSPFMDWCAANIGIGVPSMTKAAINAAASGALPPYSLKSPLLSRTMGETRSKSPAQRQQEARDDAAAAAKESSSLLAFPSMFGSSITNYLLGIFDSPAYGNLTTHFMQGTFNPSTPDDPSVKYLSVAGRTNKMSVLHPLWFPKLILDAAAERGYAEERGKSGKEYEGNDGLVSVSSAKWGEWLGTVDNCHHWDLRGEGGLLPNGPTLEDKPEGRPDPNAPGGWDWNYKDDSVLVKKAKEQKANLTSSEKKEEKAGEAWLNKQAIEKLPEMVKKATGVSGGWDMQQVGQVIDWVGDLMPGTGSSGSDKRDAVGSKQLADAAKEKEREGRERQSTPPPRDGESGRDRLVRHVASEANMRQTGDLGKRDEKASERRAGKFDLGRFYGGVAMKLHEEGY